jgi:hypothetical protein
MYCATDNGLANDNGLDNGVAQPEDRTQNGNNMAPPLFTRGIRWIGTASLWSYYNL